MLNRDGLLALRLQETGAYTVHLRYLPRSFVVGLAITVLSIAGWVLACWTFGAAVVDRGSAQPQQSGGARGSPLNAPIVSVIVPVYNEEATVGELIRRVLAASLAKELIVVDDGSTDATPQILEQLRQHSPSVQIVRQACNRGKGAALREGIARAQGDIILVQDADLEYDPTDYPALIRPLVEGKADVVYGSRLLGRHRGFTFWQRLANKLISLLASVMFNTALTDVMTGYKALRADAIKPVPLRANGFDIETEITAKLLKRGARVRETPISYVGRSRAEGKKIRWYHAVCAIYALLKYRFVD